MRRLEEDFRFWLQSEALTKGSIRNFISIFREFSTYCNAQGTTIDRATLELSRQYMVWLSVRPNYHTGEPLATSTRAKHFDFLKRLDKFLTEKGHTTESIISGIRRPIPRYKAMYGFSKDQTQLILDYAKKTRTTQRYQDRLVLLIYTLFGTGLRISEALQIIPAYIDHNRRLIKILGKANKERLVPISEQLSEQIRTYIEKYEIKRTDYLFASRYGRPLSQASVRDVMRSIRNKIGEELNIDQMRLSPHTFRHTFARQWIVNGGSTIALSRILGHVRIETTDRYVFLSGVDLVEVYDRCNPVFDLKI